MTPGFAPYTLTITLARNPHAPVARLLLAFLSTLCLTPSESLAFQERQSSESGTLRVIPDRVATIDHIKLDLKVDLENEHGGQQGGHRLPHAPANEHVDP